MKRVKHRVKAKSAGAMMMVSKYSVIPLVRIGERTGDRSEAKKTRQ